MLKLLVKLDKDMKTIEVSGRRGKEILSATEDSYQKDLCSSIRTRFVIVEHSINPWYNIKN